MPAGDVGAAAKGAVRRCAVLVSFMHAYHGLWGCLKPSHIRINEGLLHEGLLA